MSLRKKLIMQYYASWSQKDKGRIRLILEDKGQKTLDIADPLEFSVVIDLLRNEKPLYWYNDSIHTTREPVGEGE